MKRKTLLLTTAFLALVALAFLGGGYIASLTDKTTEIAPKTRTVQIEQAPLNADTIFNLVNAERVKAGLQPLERYAPLQASAQARADDMVTRDYFSHYDPQTGKAMLLDYKDTCVGISENIGLTRGYPDDNAQQMKWWLSSKPHHDAILRADYTITGVAVSGDKVVQHFCVAK